MAGLRLRRGTRFGKYRLERPLGEGAFAAVWRARDTVENRPVALKIVEAAQVAEWGRDAIAHEARIATRLSHPNIVAVRNADWIDGHFVLATDLAERSLADYAGARRSGELALRVVRDVAAGLAHAHAQGILHRDVKPENVLIFADRHAALADFGVSRFAPGAAVTVTDAGTFGYVAPEQAYGRPRLASDVFSLGIIAYELLSGRLPTWPFEWPPAGHRRFLSRVPPPLRPVLRKAAAFDPRHRYPDAVAFHQALERAFAQVEQPRTRSRRRRREKPVLSPLALQAESFRRRSGAALELRFRCHRCDGPIAEAMRVCPWCGFTPQLLPRAHALPARLLELRARRATGVDRVPVVPCGSLHGQRAQAAPRSVGRAAMRRARLLRAAAALHALLPGLQAQARPAVVAPGSSGPLHELPRPGLARLLPLLPLVRETRAGGAALRPPLISSRPPAACGSRASAAGRRAAAPPRCGRRRSARARAGCASTRRDAATRRA